MPKRTNDYQKLVETIQHLTAPLSATITPSSMERPGYSKSRREVDILVEYEVDGVRKRIAVEAKDLSRPITVQTVEEYIGKYRLGGIATDKVIIVGKNFTKDAQSRAKYVNFELHTLNSLNEQVFTKFSPQTENGDGAYVVSNHKPGQLELKIYTLKSELLKGDWHNGKLFHVNSIQCIGTTNELGQVILHNYLERLMSSLLKEHEGVMINVVAELPLNGYVLKLNTKNKCTLGRLVFDFGWNMRLPKMDPTKHELKCGNGDDGIYVQEKAKVFDGVITITYKDAEVPASLYLDTPKDRMGKKIIIRL